MHFASSNADERILPSDPAACASSRRPFACGHTLRTETATVQNCCLSVQSLAIGSWAYNGRAMPIKLPVRVDPPSRTRSHRPERATLPRNPKSLPCITQARLDVAEAPSWAKSQETDPSGNFSDRNRRGSAIHISDSLLGSWEKTVRQGSSLIVPLRMLRSGDHLRPRDFKSFPGKTGHKTLSGRDLPSDGATFPGQHWTPR